MTEEELIKLTEKIIITNPKLKPLLAIIESFDKVNELLKLKIFTLTEELKNLKEKFNLDWGKDVRITGPMVEAYQLLKAQLDKQDEKRSYMDDLMENTIHVQNLMLEVVKTRYELITEKTTERPKTLTPKPKKKKSEET